MAVSRMSAPAAAKEDWARSKVVESLMRRSEDQSGVLLLKVHEKESTRVVPRPPSMRRTGHLVGWDGVAMFGGGEGSMSVEEGGVMKSVKGFVG